MKKSVFSTLAVLCILLFTQSCIGNQSNYQEFTKEINQSFDIAPDADINISNKYGNINIRTNGSDKAVFKIIIQVKADKESQANELFNKINVDFEADSDDVSAETRISSNESWWKKWWKSNDAEYQINYDVVLPATVDLTVKNQYGNTTIETLNNALDANIRYGSLFLSDINGEMDLSIAYGNVTAGKVGDVDANISYSDEFRIQSAGNMDIESRYSKIFIDKAEDLDVESRYDEYQLGQIGNLDNSGRYDDFKIKSIRAIDMENSYAKLDIGLLERSGEVNIRSGEVRIHQVSSGFTGLDIEASYTAFQLNLKNVSYRLEIESRYTDVKLPSNFDELQREKDGNELSISGKVGANPEKALVDINTRYGRLDIQ